MIHSPILSAASSNRPLKYISKIDNSNSIRSLCNIKEVKYNPFIVARVTRNLHNFWSLDKLSSWDIEIFSYEDDEVKDIHSISIPLEVEIWNQN